MTTIEAPIRPPGRAADRTARVIRVLLSLFLSYIVVTKMLQLPFMSDSEVEMGFPASSGPIIAAILLACLVPYLVPRTEILGAILLSSFLGGALCAHFRIGAPLIPNYLVVIGTGVLVWLPLYLRNDLVRRIVHVGR